MIQIAVKTLGTLARGLRVIETIAACQPIGLSALCQELGEDKSALQRTLATLHESGWIRPLPDSPPRWELSTKPLIVAGHALDTSSLPARARPVLAALRDETGETVHLALLDEATIVVVDVAEGRHLVRTALRIGQTHPPETSAAGRALLAHLSPAQRTALCEVPGALLDPAEYERIRARGWSLCEGAVQEGSTSLAAAVTDAGGRPRAAIVVSGPDSRLTSDQYAGIAELLRDAVTRLGEGLR